MNRILLSFPFAVALAACPLAAQEAKPPVAAPDSKAVEGKPDAGKPDAGKPDAGKVQGADGLSAPRKVEAKLQPGANPANPWFPVVDLDLGTYVGSETAVGTFSFKHPGDKPVDWRNMIGSCTCSKAIITLGGRRYELTGKPDPNKILRLFKNAAGVEQKEQVQQITIEPGEEGTVEVHMDMHGVTGPRSASLDIHTTDDKLPQVKLRWNATGAQRFLISPAEVNLNQMAWNDTKEFQVTVTSPLHRDFNITRMDEAKDFRVTYEKTVANGAATWTIQGKYGPLDGETAGGGALRFYTDVPGGDPTFTVRVMAFVKGPLEVKPGAFMTLGMIRKGSGSKKQVVFEPNDGTKLEVVKYHFEKMTVDEQFVKVNQSKDGEKLVVELEIDPQAPPGLLKGDLVVELNHPLVKEKRIMFNGFVR